MIPGINGVVVVQNDIPLQDINQNVHKTELKWTKEFHFFLIKFYPNVTVVCYNN